MILFHVDVPIFSMSVVFCGGCTPEEAADALYGYEGIKAKVEFNEGTLGGVRSYKGDVYVWVKDLDRASIIIHELVHAAYSICESRGMAADEELICYLTQWLKLAIFDRVVDEIGIKESEGTDV